MQGVESERIGTKNEICGIAVPSRLTLMREIRPSAGPGSAGSQIVTLCALEAFRPSTMSSSVTSILSVWLISSGFLPETTVREKPVDSAATS